VFENRVLRGMFGPKRDDVKGEWRKLHNGSFIICTHHKILLGRSNQGECGGHAWQSGENCTGFWWESPKERARLDDRDVDGWMGLEWILGEMGGAGGVE
jgi:hypothetical protein